MGSGRRDHRPRTFQDPDFPKNCNGMKQLGGQIGALTWANAVGHEESPLSVAKGCSGPSTPPSSLARMKLLRNPPQADTSTCAVPAPDAFSPKNLTPSPFKFELLSTKSNDMKASSLFALQSRPKRQGMDQTRLVLGGVLFRLVLFPRVCVHGARLGVSPVLGAKRLAHQCTSPPQTECSYVVVARSPWRWVFCDLWIALKILRVVGGVGSCPLIAQDDAPALVDPNGDSTPLKGV